MNVAVDAREIAGRPTGVGRYLAELLAEWHSLEDARRHRWQLYTHTLLDGAHAWSDSLVVLPGAGGTAWEQWTLARRLTRDRPDVLFAPAYTAPLTAPCPVVLTVHDVSFAAHPEWFTRREGTRRRWLTGWSARRARVVLTDSEFSRREIVNHFGIPSDRTRVIPLGMREAVDRTNISAPAAPSTAPRVLFVGSIFRRRHLDVLIAAFAQVVAGALPDAELIIVGDNRLYPPADLSHQIAALPSEVASRITLSSYVTDQTLRQMYAEASLFVFLSEYEGFGLTPLEALAAGVPPLVLETPVAREVYGPAAHYVKELSPETVGHEMLTLLCDGDRRAALLRHAPAILSRYSWRQTAIATLDAITGAAIG